jgi:hypothetical protein
MNRLCVPLATIYLMCCGFQGHAASGPNETRSPMFLGFSVKQFELHQILGYVCVGQKSANCPSNYQVFYDCNWAKAKGEQKKMQDSMGSEICIKRLHADGHSSVLVKTTGEGHCGYRLFEVSCSFKAAPCGPPSSTLAPAGC